MNGSKLRGSRILMTGGTGFVGSAMLDAFYQSDVDCELCVTTRNPIAQFPDRRVKRVGSDKLSSLRSMNYIVHLEPDADHDIMADLLAASACYSRFLYASSGAAATGNTCYAKAKARHEAVLLMDAAIYRVTPLIARLWTFVGPHLPSEPYAVGNFIRDALNGGPIVVNGTGKAVRSYMYATDLAEWMWTILQHGKAGPIYNVGSEDAVAVSDLAREIAFKVNCGVVILGDLSIPNIDYVPDTGETRKELGLSVKVSRSEALDRTIEWGRNENRQ